jgi:hypothetical protein
VGDRAGAVNRKRYSAEKETLAAIGKCGAMTGTLRARYRESFHTAVGNVPRLNLSHKVLQLLVFSCFARSAYFTYI